MNASAACIIENCEFSNLTAGNDGGAIYADFDSGASRIVQTLNVVNSNFTHCTARFGGAIALQGGILNIENSNFINNTATFEGGALFTTWSKVNILTSSLINNTAEKNAGAIYFDKGKLTLGYSKLINNSVMDDLEGLSICIFAYDAQLCFFNSTFDNGGLGVYADFSELERFENITENDDLFLTDNTNYIISIESRGIRLNIIKNDTIIDEFPDKFDLRQWGCVSPVEIQGDNDDCWAFATIASLESALLKATGQYYNLSQNYVQKLQLKYYPYGDLRISLTGFAYSGLGYALSWIGVLPKDAGYDDRGMISDTDFDDERIHLQDAMIILPGAEDAMDLMKAAIMKYGSLSVQLILANCSEELVTEGDDIAFMDHCIHFISLIGWDDDYINDNGEQGGAWITKESLGGFSYVFYDDPRLLAIDYYSIVPQNPAICYIFENDVDYHVNYQTDLTGLTGFDSNYIYYSNEFTSKYDELIGAVGTYFNESEIEYSFDVYVNGEKVHSQEGVSDFAGFRTIVLSRYIPISAGDDFKVVFKNNNLPYQAYSRMHYIEGMSMVSKDGISFEDITFENKTVCLKVYTLSAGGYNGSFSALYNDIMASGNRFDMQQNYTFNEAYDKATGSFFITDLVINGNGFVIDGTNSDNGFIFNHDDSAGDENYLMNLTINNLVFKNFNQPVLGLFSGNITLNNVTFINCSSSSEALITSYACSQLTLNNINFNCGAMSNVISCEHCNLLLNNTDLNFLNCSDSAILFNRGILMIENCRFENLYSRQAAIINYKGSSFSIKNSKFLNSNAVCSGGAIIAKFFPAMDENETYYIPSQECIIENCEFINLTAGNDGGAIYLDFNSGADHILQTLNVINSNFTFCTSRFGGAIAIQGGILNIYDSNFCDNYARFEGGALFSSWSDICIINSNIFNNTAEKNAGAIYFDKGKLTLKLSNIMGNNILRQSSDSASAIYAYDVDAYFKDSTFDNGGISVYADFAANSKLENITRNDDIFLMDNKNYIVSVESQGIKLNLTKDEIIVDKLPSKFDLREWGWVSPVKIQGDNDDCWAFATVASLESSLLKATGQYYNLSQNYIQKLQLKYYPLGDLRISLTGFAYSGLGHALSWIGAIPTDAAYDDRGMLADTDLQDARIHLQDAMIILPNGNETMDMIKWAILKYGSITVQEILDNFTGELITAGEDIAVMDHRIHFITLIGWDDNYENENGTDGAWLIKESLAGFGEVYYDTASILAIDYYAIVPQNPAICYIFENDIDYHVNYQTDLTGLTGFDSNYTYYSNEFTSKYDELIGAVGTYFNGSGIDYSFDVYLNGVKVHSQSGVSEFGGFRTIILNKYIPVKAGDKFKVVFKNNNLPYQAYSRLHYVEGMSMVSKDGSSFEDITLYNKTVCLKVYTVKDDCRIVENRDMTVNYNDGSYFTVRVVTADGRSVAGGEEVSFTINGKTMVALTDNDGFARIKIAEAPGTYAISSELNGVTYKNTVFVNEIAKSKIADKIVLKAKKVTIKKKTAKKLILKATLKINGKSVKGKVIKFRFKGKTYKAKTNRKGVAQKVLKKNIIKKLKKGKKYTVKVTYLKKTIKTTVRVR